MRTLQGRGTDEVHERSVGEIQSETSRIPVAVPEKFKFVARTVDSGKGKSIQPSTYRDGWSAESSWVKTDCGHI